MVYDRLPDFYSLLPEIPRDASRSDMRSRPHPDVDTTQDTMTMAVTPPLGVSVDMVLVEGAHRTLSDVDLRAAYDGSLRREEHAWSHVVSAAGAGRPTRRVSNYQGRGWEWDRDRRDTGMAVQVSVWWRVSYHSG